MGDINPGLLRDWLVRELESAGDSRLTGVDIHGEFPGDRNVTKEMIFGGSFRPDGGTAVREMKAGTKGYQHLIVLDVIIQARLGSTPRAAEDRVVEMFNAFAAVIAANVIPYADDGTTALAYHAILGDWSLKADWTDNGAAAELVTSIRFHLDS